MQSFKSVYPTSFYARPWLPEGTVLPPNTWFTVGPVTDVVQWPSRVPLSAASWTAARQALLSSQHLPEFALGVCPLSL